MRTGAAVEGRDELRTVAGRLFAVADVFAGGEELTLGQVAERVGLPRSTTHRLLGRWVEWGGLVQGTDHRYRVGLKVWRMAAMQPTARRLRGVARPFLADLFDATHEHVHLAVRDGDAVTYVERMSGRDAVDVITDIGSRMPLHATAPGQVLLAYAGPELFEHVIAAGPRKYLPATLTEAAELRARLSQIRQTGIARCVEELTRGAVSLAAPVRDRSGQVVAAVSTIAHASRRAEPAFELGVRMAARGISSALGWRG